MQRNHPRTRLSESSRKTKITRDCLPRARVPEQVAMLDVGAVAETELGNEPGLGLSPPGEQRERAAEASSLRAWQSTRSRVAQSATR